MFLQALQGVQRDPVLRSNKLVGETLCEVALFLEDGKPMVHYHLRWFWLCCCPSRTSWSLGGSPLIMRWTGYIWLRGCPTGAPQVLICHKGCGLSRYYWPIKLTDVTNETGQQRRCEGWSYIVNPPGLEIQVIV